MAIAYKKYIDINSAVGGAEAVPTRDLIGRIMTDVYLLPTGAIIEVSSPEEAAAWFGNTTDEYYRAVWYFGFVSKQATAPKKLSYARWARSVTYPEIIGGTITKTVSQFQAYTTGKFDLTIAGVTHTITVDLSGDASYSAIAATLQSAIRAADVGNNFAQATVIYDAVGKRFNLVAGTANGNQNIAAVNSTTGQHVLDALVWHQGSTPTTGRWSNGTALQTPAEAMADSTAASDNFGSFLFNLTSLSEDEVTDVATWNDSQNVKFIYCVPVLEADAAAYSANVAELSGTALTLIDGQEVHKYPEMVPMVVLAATDYNQTNASQNYMFQQANLDYTVSDTSTSDSLDALRVNYYGVTQKAGQLIAFYQRGKLSGNNTDPIDINVYANEMWLKDRIGSELMNLLLGLNKISANRQGRATVLAGVQVGIDAALVNGTISIGKPLTNTQKAYITGLTGSPDAWHQVQNSGYWVDCVISSYVGNSGTEWKATYTLIYSKDDAIRKVDGSHVLI